jgi:predicted Zn-dependent protease
MIAIITVMLFSCASGPVIRHKTQALYGMIYDRDNRPVTNAAVYVNGKYQVSSDINGHFTIPDMKPKLSYSVSVEKQNYKTITLTISYMDPSYILYIHMPSGDQLLSEAESAIKEKNWQQAESLLEEAGKAGVDEVSLEFLRAVLAYSREQYDDALEILLELTVIEKNAPYLYLFIADIYQYKTSNPGKSRDYLERFLELSRNEDVEARLKVLSAP